VNFDDYTTRDARLVILRALHEQTDRRLNEALLTATLDRFGHRRSREWVRTQIGILAELGAVTYVDASETVRVAKLTRLGIDHVEERQVIDGIARPSPEN
jgi:hypothetical protein